MPRQPVTEEQFTELSKKIAEEIQSANVDYRMYHNVHDACVKNEVVVQQSRAFWPMTLDAHLNSAILRLCRVYDTQHSSLNLAYWLTLIQSNPQWFTEEAFEARKSNPISSYHGPLDIAQLIADITFAKPSNHLVKNLIMFRGNILAHIGENWVLNRRNTRTSFNVTLGDLGTLATKGLEIINRYWGYYDSQSFSPNLIGATDFAFIFKELNKAIERLKDERTLHQ